MLARCWQGHARPCKWHRMTRSVRSSGVGLGASPLLGPPDPHKCCVEVGRICSGAQHVTPRSQLVVKPCAVYSPVAMVLA